MSTTTREPAVLVSEAPVSGPAGAWQFPTVIRRSYDGGNIVAADMPGFPLATVSLIVPGGSLTDPAGREGLAQLTGSLVGRGPVGHDTTTFALATERLGAGLRTPSDNQAMYAAADAPADKLAAAAELLAAAVRSPRLDDESVALLRGERVQGLRTARANPGFRAGLVWSKERYAAGDRFAVDSGGTEESNAAITADDVRAFHAATFTGGGTLVVAGDLTLVDLDGLAATLFSGKGEGATFSNAPHLVQDAAKPRIILVDRPGAAQSVIRAGHSAPLRDHQDYVALNILGNVLGSGMSSRLMQRLRQDKGYTYGVSGSFSMTSLSGSMSVSTNVHTPFTAPAVADIVAEITKLRDAGASEAEVSGLRTKSTASYPSSFQSASAVASGLSTLVLGGYADDHHTVTRARFAAVTTAEVNAATSFLKPEQLLFVIEGDAAQVRGPLEELGLGEVQFIPAD